MNTWIQEEWKKKQTLTVMHPLTYRLQHLHVNRRRATIIPIVLILSITKDTLCAFMCCERDRRLSRHTRNNCSCVKRENRLVDVYRVWVEDFREGEWWEDWWWEVGREWVFIWAKRELFSFEGLVLGCVM